MEKISKILNLVLKILLIVLIGVTTLLSLTMAYIMFAPDSFPKPFYLNYSYPNGGSSTPNEVVVVVPTPTPTLEPGKGIMYNTGSKIINLNEPNGRRYIKVSITLEFEPHVAAVEKPATGGGEGAAPTVDPSTAFQTEISAKAPIIDDIIISLISQKKFDELYTADGKEKLRKEIMDQLNSSLPEYRIMSVYFTEFVVE
jgi:flagellar basal body-associated protein FliL